MTELRDEVAQAFAEEMEAPETQEVFEPQEPASPQDAPTEQPEGEEPSHPSAEAPTQAEPEEIEPWVHTLARALRSNPTLAQDVVALERGERVAVDRELLDRVQQYQEPEPDPSDSIEERVATDPFGYMVELDQRQRQFDRFIAEQQRESNKNALGTGIAAFRKEHELSDEEMVKVMAEVHKHGFLRPDSAFMQEAPNKQAAVRQAFEVARRIVNPERTTTPQQQAADLRSKRKAAAANVSPRSASRQQAEPTSPAEHMAAAAAEFRVAMRGN